MAELKNRLVQVVLNLPQGYVRDKEYIGGPHNVKFKTMMAYYDYKKQQFVWVDEFNNVRSTDKIKQDDQVKILEVSVDNPSFNISISPNLLDSEKRKREAVISFLENWPIVAHAKAGEGVSSFPTENHRYYFVNYYQIDNEAVLSTKDQPLKLVDNYKVEKIKNENLKRDMEFVRALNTLEESPESLEKCAYILGLNPKDLEPFEVQNKIYEFVKASELYDEFFKVFKERSWDDPASFVVALGVSENIIMKSDMGVYQYDGRSIANNLQDAAYYFRTNIDAYNNLRIQLIGRANTSHLMSNVSDDPMQKLEKKIKKSKPQTSSVSIDSPDEEV